MLETSQFWPLVKKGLAGPRTEFSRIENSVIYGMPDTALCHEGRDAWVELKVIRDGQKPILRPAQRGWLMKRAAIGSRNVFVLAYREGVLQLWGPDEMRALCSPGRCPKPLWSCPQPWDWDALRDLLFGSH